MMGRSIALDGFSFEDAEEIKMLLDDLYHGINDIIRAVDKVAATFEGKRQNKNTERYKELLEQLVRNSKTLSEEVAEVTKTACRGLAERNETLEDRILDEHINIFSNCAENLCNTEPYKGFEFGTENLDDTELSEYEELIADYFDTWIIALNKFQGRAQKLNESNLMNEMSDVYISMDESIKKCISSMVDSLEEVSVSGNDVIIEAAKERSKKMASEAEQRASEVEKNLTHKMDEVTKRLIDDIV